MEARQRKYIEEWLKNHNYEPVQIRSCYLNEIYNLYKFGIVPPQMTKDIYWWYGVYYEGTGHLDNAKIFYEMCYKLDPTNIPTLKKLVEIYKKSGDRLNLLKVYKGDIATGSTEYVEEAIGYMDEIYGLLVNDDQKYVYLVAVSKIPNHKFTKDMLNDLCKMKLADDAPLSLKLMNGLFNGVSF